MVSESAPIRHRSLLRRMLAKAATLSCACLLLAGCASDGKLGKAMDRTLEAVGVKDAAPPPPQDKTVPVRILGGGNLNAGNGTKGLSVVVKLYQLRQRERFDQLPYNTFLDESRERKALGDDLLASTELLLTPRQTRDLQEKVSKDAPYLGVVALFRGPAASRWRLTFDTEKAAKDGITLGVHACAMTTTSPALLTVVAGEPHSLSAVTCPR